MACQCLKPGGVAGNAWRRKHWKIVEQKALRSQIECSSCEAEWWSSARFREYLSPGVERSDEENAWDEGYYDGLCDGEGFGEKTGNPYRKVRLRK